MALHIVDRRLAGKNKSIGNRERFLRRYQTQIREAVREAMAGRNIRDIRQSQSVTIPRKDISQPVFGHGSGGVRDSVHPGNKDYLRGDHIARPQPGGKGSGGQASDGDNFSNDSGRCSELLETALLPLCRFYAYVQVAQEEQNLWQEYAAVAAQHSNFAMRKVEEPSDIYPVFHDLFKRDKEAV